MNALSAVRVRWLRRLVAAGLLVVGVLGLAGYLVLRWYASPVGLEEPVVVVIDEGDSVARVAKRLQVAGVIRRPALFRWLVRLSGDARRIRSGEYRIEPGHSPRDVTATIVRGDVVVHWVSLIEGNTVSQTLARLRQTPPLLITVTSPDEVVAALALTVANPEGMFFPDTYPFELGDRDVDVLGQAYARMRSVLDREWRSRAVGLPFDDPYQALVLASIIEKESGMPQDRRLIGQVFVSRLMANMRLQTDPSVIYGLGGVFDGNLTREDLKRDTPYNTYTRRGLPPTPIALPSLASIRAALQPADTDYLYFVARGDGSSEFSRTLAEHRAAVRRYQLAGDDS